METKICVKCSLEKKVCEFNLRTKSKDGYSSYCKECVKTYSSERYDKNKEKICKDVNDYRKLNYDKIKESKLKRKDKIKITSDKYRKENKEKISITQKNYHSENKDKLSEKHKEYMKVYMLTEAYKNTKKRQYLKDKEQNPHILAWRNTLNSSLLRLNKSKEGHTIDLLGYSALELKNHITSLFTDGMSWNNYGEWHIDHIKMICDFESDTPMDIVNALSNLRPLWATTREINGIIYEGNLNRKK